MQQPVIEEGAVFEPPRSYDDLFPALPEFTPVNVNTNSAMGLWNNNTMRVGSSTVTQVFRLVLTDTIYFSFKYMCAIVS